MSQGASCRIDPALGYLPAPIPSDEPERLAEVRRLGLLDTAEEERFSRFSRLAAQIFNVPIAYVALVDANRQWFKTQIGMPMPETPRESSFCGHAVMQDKALVIPDARKDLRFAGNPLVIHEPYVRFYAGRPLRGPGGHKVGTLCVLDREPREFGERDLQILDELAQMVEHEFSVQDQIAEQAAALQAREELAKSQRQLSIAMEELNAAKQKSDQLLENILPAGLAVELQETGKVTPVQYDEVAVLFADFSGFTKVAAVTTPEDLLTELNDCFCHFDWVAARHEVEKLKTIGDGYLAVAGMPRQEGDALRLLRAAFEMRDFIRDRQTALLAKGKPYWNIRVGLHVGPLVAGVVGARKIAYDVWGDTVNTASRIETAGVPGRINASEEFYNRVAEHVVGESRGPINCKNKGEVHMFFIDALK